MKAMQVGSQHVKRTGRQIAGVRPMIAALAAAISACVGVASPVTADTWAERLGFPVGAKVIVLHAHDMGMCYETNSVGARLIASGAVRSASVMVPGPWFGDFARWSREHPDADIGVDLTLNSEWATYRWQPVAPREFVPSLTDADGFFWRTPVQTMVSATAEDVERELHAQIARAKEAGIRATHLTTHLGALVTRPDLMEVYLRIARQQWIPAMIVELTPDQVERFRSQGFPLPDDVIAMLGEYPLPKVDDLRFVPVADSFDQKKQAFLTMLRELSPGITQIAIHPAAASDALPRIMPEWQQRVWSAQLVVDDEVRQALQSDGVILTDWRELMQRFEGRAASLDEPARLSSDATE